MKSFINYIREMARRRVGPVSRQVFRGAASAAIMRVINAGLMFITAIVLARFLGVDEYGILAYAMSWVTLLGVFAKLGLTEVIVANVAVYHQRNDWSRIRGILRFSLFAVAVGGVACALVMAGAGWSMHRNAPALFHAFLLACLLLPLQSVLALLGATQTAFRQITAAQLPGMLIMPAVFLTLIMATYSLTPVAHSAASAIILQIAAASTALLAAILLLRKGFRAFDQALVLHRPRYEARSWIMSALPLVLMGSMTIANNNADILMLGALSGPAQAGLYKAAARGAELVIFSLTVVSVPLGPLIAGLHATNAHDQLQHLLTRWARLAFVPAAFIAVFLFMYGDWFLSLFGSDFVTAESHTALRILSLAQIFAVSIGHVGLLLVMTGQGRFAAITMTLAVILNIGLNAVLIPFWGICGAATATAASTIFWSIALVVITVHRLKLNPTIFPMVPGLTLLQE